MENEVKTHNPKSVRVRNVIYWVTTIIIALGGISAGIGHLTRSQHYVELFKHLGYPYYFVMLLGVWKILGSVAITIPRFPLLKEWAYAGLMFDFTGAVASHIAVGDGIVTLIGPLVSIVIIVISYLYRPDSRKLMHKS